AFAHAFAQTGRHFDQQGVARIVAAAVIELLEVVEIEEDESEMDIAALAFVDVMLETFEQQPAIGKLRQHVVESEEAQLLFGVLLLGDVGMYRHPEQALLRMVEFGDGNPAPYVAAILAGVEKLA